MEQAKNEEMFWFVFFVTAFFDREKGFLRSNPVRMINRGDVQYIRLIVFVKLESLQGFSMDTRPTVDKTMNMHQ
jgi:hypothetical protein